MKNALVFIVGILSAINSNAQSTSNEFDLVLDEQTADLIYLSAYPEERIVLQKVLVPQYGQRPTPEETASAKIILNRIKNDLSSASKPMMTSKGR